MTVIAAGRPAAPRALIAPELFTRLTYRVMDDSGADHATAERITGQALAFLATCARCPEGSGLSPSRDVDYGWHAFILHTREYADFCDRVAGRFIHHEPDSPGEPGARREAVSLTVRAMLEGGFTVDTNLWIAGADCSQCHEGCHDSPKAGS